MDSLVRIFELHQAVADLVIQQANFAGGLFDRGVLKVFGELCKRYVKLLRNVRAARLLKSLIVHVSSVPLLRFSNWPLRTQKKQPEAY